jgi:hypothetical protein
MKKVVLATFLAVASAAAQESLPPPPPPPPYEPPPPPGAQGEPAPSSYYPPPAPRADLPAAGAVAPRAAPSRTTTAASAATLSPTSLRSARSKYVPGTIGEGPVATAGAQAAPLHPDESLSNWQFSLATGYVGRWGGMALSSTRANSSSMLYFGAQADGLWSEGVGKAARLRLRLMTGGQDALYLPSDGDAEAAFMIGRRELRFVMGRLEYGRSPALAIQSMLQLATLPCFEGSVAFAGDRMRLYYYLSPVEAAWVYYYGREHIHSQPGWRSEAEEPSAASAVRARYTAMVPPSVIVSVQGDFVKFWNKADQLVSGEGSVGYSVLEQTVLLQVAIRADQYTRRGITPGSSSTQTEVKLLTLATLAF